MRKTAILAAVMVALFMLSVTAQRASASTTYAVVISTSTSGEVKDVASGSVYCNIRYDGSDFYKSYQDSHSVIYTRGLPGTDYIYASLYTILQAPGWFDHAYRSVDVYKNGVSQQHMQADTDSSLSGTQTTNTFATGGVKWSFVVQVWGTDWGSENCRYTATFNLGT
jgi:hypothetical protein